MPGAYQMHHGTPDDGCGTLLMKLILLFVVLVIFATFIGVKV